MKLDSLKTILIAGVNTRPIAKSANDLGLEVIAVDRFEDLDLRKTVDSLYTPKKEEEQPRDSSDNSTEDFFDLSLKALNLHDIDAAIITSGMEHYPGKIRKLNKQVPIIGNEPEALDFCEGRRKLFRLAENLGISHPKTKQVETLDEALQAAHEVGLPALLKPPSSGGGIGIKLVRKFEELENSFHNVLSISNSKSIYLQEFIQGVDASASVVSNGDEARCLTVTEQIIGDKQLGVPREFGYCGNIIPSNLEDGIISKISKFSERICSEIGLLGSNGVDFVVSDRPYLMEVNPRFQNTIDMVEGCFDLNLLKAHIESTNGDIISKKRLKKHSAKLIVYAKKDIRAPNLSHFPNVVDVPRKNSKIKKKKPICSILKFGGTRDKVVKDAYRLASEVQQKCYSSSK